MRRFKPDPERETADYIDLAILNIVYGDLTEQQMYRELTTLTLTLLTQKVTYARNA